MAPGTADAHAAVLGNGPRRQLEPHGSHEDVPQPDRSPGVRGHPGDLLQLAPGQGAGPPQARDGDGQGALTADTPSPTTPPPSLYSPTRTAPGPRGSGVPLLCGAGRSAGGHGGARCTWPPRSTWPSGWPALYCYAERSHRTTGGVDHGPPPIFSKQSAGRGAIARRRQAMGRSDARGCLDAGRAVSHRVGARQPAARAGPFARPRPRPVAVGPRDASVLRQRRPRRPVAGGGPPRRDRRVEGQLPVRAGKLHVSRAGGRRVRASPAGGRAGGGHRDMGPLEPRPGKGRLRGEHRRAQRALLRQRRPGF